MIGGTRFILGLCGLALLAACTPKAPPRKFFSICSESDHCESGTCFQSVCTSTCASTAECGEGVCIANHCLLPARVQCGSAGDCDFDPGACRQAACQNGRCLVVALADGGVCPVGGKCSASGLCTAGKCVAKAGAGALQCGDDNPCTADDCDPAKGCVHAAVVAGCDDGDACTVADACMGGVCAGGKPAPCDDSNPCTADTCDSKSGCAHAGGAGPCEDGNPCSVDDFCSGGKCATGKPRVCDDKNGCTKDNCDVALGCVAAPIGGSCDDGNPCTAKDGCDGGACKPGKADGCDDGNMCTADPCAPGSGCAHTATANACSDGNACTAGDLCTAGTCKGGDPTICDDGNSCTGDACDPGKGCVYVALLETTCDDGNACTTGDGCVKGACAPGGPNNCDDGNACTLDGCTIAKGCGHTQVTGGACSDGDACTLGDVCSKGLCKGGEPKVCDDGKPCTQDSCGSGFCFANVLPTGTPCGPNGAACVEGLQNDPDLLGHWSFDLCNGNDSSKAANHGAFKGKVGCAPTPFATGIVLDGSGLVLVPSSPSLDVTATGLTFGGWVRDDASPDYSVMMCREQGFEAGVIEGKASLAVSVGAPNAWKWQLGSPLAKATWTHVAVVHDAKGHDLYIDASATAHVDAPGSVPPTGCSLGIGGRESPCNSGNLISHWKGMLDEMFVFRRALKPLELEALRQGEWGSACVVPK